MRIYRTAEGRIGCQIDLMTVTAGDRMRLDQAYEAILDAVGERRGRPRGVKKVQTKLMLPEPASGSFRVVLPSGAAAVKAQPANR